MRNFINIIEGTSGSQSTKGNDLQVEATILRFMKESGFSFDKDLITKIVADAEKIAAERNANLREDDPYDQPMDQDDIDELVRQQLSLALSRMATRFVASNDRLNDFYDRKPDIEGHSEELDFLTREHHVSHLIDVGGMNPNDGDIRRFTRALENLLTNWTLDTYNYGFDEDLREALSAGLPLIIEFHNRNK